MSDARNELAGIARQLILNPPNTAFVTDAIADAILAAGYSKPRTIEWDHEADELPVGTVVLGSDGDVARKFRGGWRTLVTESDGTAWLSGHMEDPDYPATVLHTPKAAQ